MSFKQIWQSRRLEAELHPACFDAFDFFGHEVAKSLAQRFFKGRLMLVTRAQVEDPTFWAAHDIALAVSFNGGCFQREGNEHNRGWFTYPLGRKALNIPITSGGRCVERTRSCLPHVVGALACAKTVALHCLHTVHRGPVGAGMLVMTMCPHATDEAWPGSVMRVIKTKWPRMSNAVLQVGRPRDRRDAMLWERFRELVADVIPRSRVPDCILHGGPPTFNACWTVAEVTLWQAVHRLIDTPDENARLEQLQLLLTESQRGIQEGLPRDELHETWADWQHNYGKGKEKGKAKGKVAETKGGQGGKGKEKGKVADGKGGKDGKGKEQSQVADSKGKGGKGSQTPGIQADATINAMFRTCSRNV